MTPEDFGTWSLWGGWGGGGVHQGVGGQPRVLWCSCGSSWDREQHVVFVPVVVGEVALFARRRN